MASGNRQLPLALFPNDLDDWSNLLKVFDTSESILEKSISPMDDSISIVPDFLAPERWSEDGGFGHVGEEGEEGEDFYYAIGEFAYHSVNEKISTFTEQTPSGIAVKTGDVFAIDFVHGEVLIGNLAAKPKSHYTAAGRILVAGVEVDFAVSGNGRHGSGSNFIVTRPDLVQRSGCSVDANLGEITFSVSAFNYQILSLTYGLPDLDVDGTPLKRVFRLNGITRNLRGTKTTRHEKGAYVRGYIVSEHYKLLVQALLATEEFAGVDFSEDKRSLDYRLRDLQQICIEADDWGCPDVDVSFERNPALDDCQEGNEFDFQVSIKGDFDNFVLNFGDGTSTTNQQGIKKIYPPDARVEPSAVVTNERCVVANAFFQTTVEAVPDIPQIVCPDITIPEPVLLPEFLSPIFNPPGVSISINFPSISLPSQITINSFTLPTFISIPPVTFPDISISIPDFSITIPPFVYTLSISLSGPDSTNPCFQLVACESGHCHGLS